MSEAKIEVFSRKIKSSIPLPKNPQHLFIIYTNSSGNQIIIRGGPVTDNVFGMIGDNLRIVVCPFDKDYEDLFGQDEVQGNASTIISSGSDEAMQVYIGRIWNIAQKINDTNLDYKLPIFECDLDLCHFQNSNTVIRILLEKAGLEFKLPEIDGEPVNAPGINGEIRNTQFDISIQNYLDSFASNEENKCFQKKSNLPSFSYDFVEESYSSTEFNIKWEESCPGYAAISNKDNFQDVEKECPDVFGFLEMWSSNVEIHDPDLTSSERLRLFGKEQEEGGAYEFANMFKNLADQTDLVLSFLNDLDKEKDL